MTVTGVEAFLRAEEEASQLVAMLSRLKEEVESYAAARVALDETAHTLGAASGQLADLAGRLGGVVEALRSIGTQELLEGQSALSNQMAEMRETTVQGQQSVASTIERAAEEARAYEAEAKAKIAATEGAVEKLRWLILGASAILLVAVVAVGVLVR